MKPLLRSGLLLCLLGSAAAARDEEPELPRGEWLLLEGRSEEAVRWYRERYASDPGPRWQEGLAEALSSLGGELLARHRPVEAKRALEEARELSRDEARLDRIRHLIAYADERTAGHAIFRGHEALANGRIEAAVSEYEQALRDAMDDFERVQGRTLLALALLLEGALSSVPTPFAEQAERAWKEGGSSAEDAEKFLWASRVNGGLRLRLEEAATRLRRDRSEQGSALRAIVLCLLLRTGEAEEALEEVSRPGWRGPLVALLERARRWTR